MSSTAIAFDTLQYAKRLQKAGFTEQQAEVQAESIKELIEDKLATKEDIRKLEELITLMGYKLTIRLGAMITAAVVVLGVLIPLMLKFLGGH